MGCDAARGELVQVSMNDGPPDIIVRFRSRTGREFIVPFKDSYHEEGKGSGVYYSTEDRLKHWNGWDFDAIDVLRSAYEEVCRANRVGLRDGALFLNLSTAEVTHNAPPDARKAGLSVTEAHHILAVCYTAKDPRDLEAVKAAAVYSRLFPDGNTTLDAMQSERRFGILADKIVAAHADPSIKEEGEAPFEEKS